MPLGKDLKKVKFLKNSDGTLITDQNYILDKLGDFFKHLNYKDPIDSFARTHVEHNKQIPSHYIELIEKRQLRRPCLRQEDCVERDNKPVDPREIQKEVAVDREK